METVEIKNIISKRKKKNSLDGFKSELKMTKRINTFEDT